MATAIRVRGISEQYTGYPFRKFAEIDDETHSYQVKYTLHTQSGVSAEIIFEYGIDVFTVQEMPPAIDDRIMNMAGVRVLTSIKTSPITQSNHKELDEGKAEMTVMAIVQDWMSSEFKNIVNTCGFIAIDHSPNIYHDLFKRELDATFEQEFYNLELMNEGQSISLMIRN